MIIRGNKNGFGNDSHCKLLLHCNGTNGSTTFTDSEAGGSAKTITANGNAQISTAQSKFGGASGSFNGNATSYLSIPDDADFDFGAGDFTIDLWTYLTEANRMQALICKGDSSATDYSHGEFYFVVGSDNKASFDLCINGNNHAAAIDTATLSINNWHHLAVVRYGADLYLFVDGIKKATGNASTLSVNNIGVGVKFSRYGDWNGGNRSINGYIDEVRVSKGIARWKSNFVIPNRAY